MCEIDMNPGRIKHRAYSVRMRSTVPVISTEPVLEATEGFRLYRGDGARGNCLTMERSDMHFCEKKFFRATSKRTRKDQPRVVKLA